MMTARGSQAVDMTEQPTTRYNLADERVEQKNLIANPEDAPRLKRMEKEYRNIRSSKRSAETK